MSQICFVGDSEPSPPPDSTRRETDFVHLNPPVADLTAASSSSAPPHYGGKQGRLRHLPGRRYRSAGESSVRRNNVDDVKMMSNNVKYGVTSVCGRRRKMDDTVSIHPSFATQKYNKPQYALHFFGVFHGYGCSHVSEKCENRMHEIVKEEIERELGETEEWEKLMRRSFSRMDDEIKGISHFTCTCQFQCDAVGSTALVAVLTPDKFIISNCGDSRSVLCRKTSILPLSSDHKAERADELGGIQSSGGRVIHWEGARVLGVLAKSRAIRDGYLKPYVMSEPEVAVMDRTAEDEFMVLASDGLWDVVSNQTACDAVRTYMESAAETAAGCTDFGSDEACSEASIVLTKLAMAKQSSDNISVVLIDLKTDH